MRWKKSAVVSVLEAIQFNLIECQMQKKHERKPQTLAKNSCFITSQLIRQALHSLGVRPHVDAMAFITFIIQKWEHVSSVSMRQLATESHIVTFPLNMLHIVTVCHTYCHTYGYISSHMVSNCCCQARGALSIQRCSLSELDGSVEMAFAQYWYKENQQKLSWCLGLILGTVWSLKGWSIAAFMKFSAKLAIFPQ